MCWFLVPALEATYRGLNVPPGSGLRVLQAIRDTLPYWVAIPPLALLLAVLWSRFGGNSLAWVPGMSGLISEHRATNFAESLASLLESGSPLPEGLRLAAAAWSDEALERETLHLAAAFERGRPAEDSPPALRMPPFLRWAIWHGDDTIGRTRALRLAASTYREAAERRVSRLQVTAPLVACVLLGGGVTLLYGLALFVPLAQLIRGLAA
jgi:type II secretory pathway component PulF